MFILKIYKTQQGVSESSDWWYYIFKIVSGGLSVIKVESVSRKTSMFFFCTHGKHLGQKIKIHQKPQISAQKHTETNSVNAKNKDWELITFLFDPCCDTTLAFNSLLPSLHQSGKEKYYRDQSLLGGLSAFHRT